MRQRMGKRINKNKPKIYLVGGAVRDKLLGFKVKERDFVVVGSTPEEMLKLGYKQVGRDFPVFLHPKTHEEYALARTERKTGKGYTGFQCFTAKSVTLEEDLMRRDITINAIAQERNGKIIDPFRGTQDLKKKLLRHVSEAFAEDPVRILRVARFASRFCDFKVHPTTYKLMRQMLAAGEVDALVPERIWQELVRALGEKCPERFFAVLDVSHALPVLFPEIMRAKKKILVALMFAVKLTINDKLDEDSSKKIRFAAMWGSLDLESAKALGKRLRVPSAYQDLTILIIKYNNIYKKLSKFKAETLLQLFEVTDAFRRKERFVEFLYACEANAKPTEIVPREKILAIYNKVSKISISKLLTKKQIAADNIREEVHNIRLAKIIKYL